MFLPPEINADAAEEQEGGGNLARFGD